MKKIKSLIKKIVFVIHKLFYNVYYPLYFKLNIKRIIKNYKPDGEIIISLTSFPARIKSLHFVIKSLLNQQFKAKKIILWLAIEDFGNEKVLPSNLTSLVCDYFEIKWCDNLKPHKKYFYTMKENYDSPIITVDDDAFYKKNLVKDLYNESLKFKDCVICTRAHYIKIENNIIDEYNNWEFETNKLYKKSDYIFATGVGGVFYPAKCFGEKVFDKEAIIKYCLNADDIWLKANEIMYNKKVVCINHDKTKYLVPIINSEKVRLSRKNVDKNENDIQLQQVFDYLEIGVKDFG